MRQSRARKEQKCRAALQIAPGSSPESTCLYRGSYPAPKVLDRQTYKTDRQLRQIRGHNRAKVLNGPSARLDQRNAFAISTTAVTLLQRSSTGRDGSCIRPGKEQQYSSSENQDSSHIARSHTRDSFSLRTGSPNSPICFMKLLQRYTSAVRSTVWVVGTRNKPCKLRDTYVYVRFAIPVCPEYRAR